MGKRVMVLIGQAASGAAFLAEALNRFEGFDDEITEEIRLLIEKAKKRYQVSKIGEDKKGL